MAPEETRPKRRRLKLPSEIQRKWPQMDAIIVYRPEPVRVTLEMNNEESSFHLIPDTPRATASHPVNAYQMCDRFCLLKTAYEAADFFRGYGMFGRKQKPSKSPSQTLRWDELQKWQRLISKGRLTSVSVLFTSARRFETEFTVSQPDFHFRSKEIPSREGGRAEFQLHFPCSTILDTLVSVVWVDYFAGFEYRACARKGCPRLYLVTTNHKRQYCCQPCAHMASVEGRRANAAT